MRALFSVAGKMQPSVIFMDAWWQGTGFGDSWLCHGPRLWDLAMFHGVFLVLLKYADNRSSGGPITLTSAGIMRYDREAMKGFSLRVWADIYIYIYIIFT